MNSALIHYLGTLPPEVRREAEEWRDALETVRKPIQESLALVASRFGVSLKTARRKYDAWRKAHGSIRSLVNKAKVPEAQSALTPEFLDWFKALAEDNKRKTRPAHRAFAKLWRNGAQIPGMNNELPRHELPAGFTYDNITRKIKDSFALAATRRGLAFAVGDCGPQIFSTRANLWYGSHLMIDDLWHDNFVVFGRQLVRVLELDALDVFSGYLETFGCKPRFRRETDGKFDNLKESFARLIVASVFYHRGYSPRGSWVLAEHGTAAISEAVAKILFDRSGGKIRLRESGITGEEQAVLGWRGQGKGNFRFKAALESIRNLKHNELGAIPAQTGMNRDTRPEFTHGLLVQASEEMKVLESLAKRNPQRAAAFKLRLWDYHAHFLPFLMDAYREINARDWHDLEGWHKAGNIAIEYRTTPSAGQWLTDAEFAALPATSQQLLLQCAAADDRFIRQRKLSPLEVARRDAAGLVKLPAFAVCEILGEDCAREQTVTGAYFNEFQDQELAPEALRFESVITTPEGREEQLADGKYNCFVNPFDLDQLFVCDARNRCLGMARRVQRVCPTDDEGLKRAFGRREHRIAELKKPILQRHAGEVREEMARLEHNAQVIEDIEGITDAKRQARNLKKFDGDVAELAAPTGDCSGESVTAENAEPTEDFSAEGLL